MNKVAMITILLMLPLSNCLGEDLSEDSDTETVVGTCGDDLFVEYESHWGCKFEVEFKQEVTLNWWIDVPDVDWDIDVYFMNDYNFDIWSIYPGYKKKSIGQLYQFDVIFYNQTNYKQIEI